MKAIDRADELSADPDTVAGLAHTSFEDVRDAQLAADGAQIEVLRPLNANDDVRPTTFMPSTRARSFRSCSARPSEKYSLSRSSLRFTKGRTAIDGRGSVALAVAPAAGAGVTGVSAPR